MLCLFIDSQLTLDRRGGFLADIVSPLPRVVKNPFAFACSGLQWFAGACTKRFPAGAD